MTKTCLHLQPDSGNLDSPLSKKNQNARRHLPELGGDRPVVGKEQKLSGFGNGHRSRNSKVGRNGLRKQALQRFKLAQPPAQILHGLQMPDKGPDAIAAQGK
jgi:hypothetical protein